MVLLSNKGVKLCHALPPVVVKAHCHVECSHASGKAGLHRQILRSTANRVAGVVDFFKLQTDFI